jgi:hypothetical protein
MVPLSISHKTSYTNSDFISLFGNSVVRATAPSMLYAVFTFTTSLHLPNTPSPAAVTYGRAFAIRALTIASKIATLLCGKQTPHRTNIADTTTTTAIINHHV